MPQKKEKKSTSRQKKPQKVHPPVPVRFPLFGNTDDVPEQFAEPAYESREVAREEMKEEVEGMQVEEKREDKDGMEIIHVDGV